MSGGSASSCSPASGVPESIGGGSSSGQPRSREKQSNAERRTTTLPRLQAAQAAACLFQVGSRRFQHGSLEVRDPVVRPIEQNGDQLPAFFPVQTEDLFIHVVVRRGEDQDLVLERGHVEREANRP